MPSPLRHLLAAPALLAHRLAIRYRPAAPGIRLLLLHDVAPDEMAAFERLVAALAREGRLASPADAEAVLAGAPVPRGPERCVVTFDDGFASNVAACEVLERNGARALLFLCPGLMDLPRAEQRAAVAAAVFDGRRTAADLPPHMTLMGWDEAVRLTGRGHLVGNHTARHRRLTALAPEEAEADMVASKRRLEERLGAAVEWFAFPFGDIDSVDAATLAAAGRHHRFVRSGIRGANRPGTARLAVLADHVDLAAPWAWQRLVVEGGLDGRYDPARRRLARLAAAGE